MRCRVGFYRAAAFVFFDSTHSKHRDLYVIIFDASSYKLYQTHNGDFFPYGSIKRSTVGFPSPKSQTSMMMTIRQANHHHQHQNFGTLEKCVAYSHKLCLRSAAINIFLHNIFCGVHNKHTLKVCTFLYQVYSNKKMECYRVTP